jgi:phosphate starvation-inducible PhoH-like protein
MARKPHRASSEAHRTTHSEPSSHYGAAHDGGHRNDPHRRARVEVEFDEQTVLGALFGQFDTNLVQIENRLGVFISARGNRALIEGPDDAVARARDVLRAMHQRALSGQELDAGAVDALIAMSSEPTLEGIITGEPMENPPILIRTRRKTIAPRSKTQIEYMRALIRDDMIFALGPAGTGKTYLAVAQAVAQLMSGSVQRLILSRPAVEAGERLGFLPGDMKEKVDPYLRPLYDALYDCMPPEQVERRMASGEIEVAPIAFMRGRTLADAFVILDEAQNTTPAQMKMFLTRFGQNSRMVICGDPRQVDLPGGVAGSGLADAVRRLEGVEGIGTVRFTVGDVVRHPIVGRVVEAYEGEGALP